VVIHSDALVSIILPYLNMARYLPAAVESVLAQSHSAWELIIVDDSSRAEEAHLARELAARYAPRVRMLTHADGLHHGASAARNLGLADARGELVAFLDADDIWLPEKLSHQVDRLNRLPQAAMTFARVRYFSDDAHGAPDYDQPFGPLQEGLYEPPRLTLEFLLDASIYPCPTAVLVRRDALRAVGGFDPGFRKVRTDLVAWTKINTHYIVHADPTIVARYRQHPASSVAQMNAAGEFLKYELDFYRWLLRYIERLPSEVRAAIEPIACERMYYYSVQQALRAGWRSRLAWRLAVGPQLAKYRAFWRRGRWLKAMFAGRALRCEEGTVGKPE
jgi:glycosyltransferase involved in cell wall biosynthesis